MLRHTFSVTLLPSAQGFGRNLSRELDGDLQRAGRDGGRTFAAGMGGSVKSASRTIFAPLLAAGAGIKLAGLFKDSISAASDLEESTNKVSEIFGDADKAVFKFTKNAAEGIGQSDRAARDAAATFGIFGKAAGISGEELATFSTDFTTLASDLASFNNTSPEQAVQAIGAALRGESEPIRQYGVLLDDATLRQEALKLGLIETTSEALTPQNRVLAAQAQIYKQTRTAQGDFGRTSDGLANKQRQLTAQFENAKAELGRGLLPIANDVVGFLNDEGIPAFRDFAGFLNDDVIPAAKDVADVVKDIGKAFGSLPGDVQKILLAGAGIGGVALKARSVLKGGSLLGGVASKGAPVPVVVTNPGFNAPGGGKGGKGGGLFAAGRGVGGAGALLALLSAPELPFFNKNPLNGSSNEAKGLPAVEQYQKLSTVLGQLNEQFKVGAQELGGLKINFGELDAGLADMIRRDPAGLGRDIRSIAKESGVSFDVLADKIPLTAARLEGLSGVIKGGYGRAAEEASGKTKFFDSQLEILNGTLDETGKKKPEPTVSLDDKASKPIGSVQGLLGVVDRTTAQATATVDISQALARIDTLRGVLNGISSTIFNLENAADKAAQDAKDRARDQSLERAVGRGAENGTKQGLNDRSRGLTSGRR